jgi:hypothetical protein
MIGRRPFAAFGNSTGDLHMPEYITAEYNTSNVSTTVDIGKTRE